MNITLASAFRNSTAYLPRYFDQVVALHDALSARGDKLTCLWGEGDSYDDGRTLAMLEAMRWRLNSTVIDCTHGGKPYGSIVNLQRFRQLAHVGNTIWAQIPADADVFVWVESDLIWDAKTLVRLIDHLALYDMVAPMVLDRLPDTGAEANVTFYDTFCFRRRGQRFAKAAPYHPDLPAIQRMARMESVGSCVAMPAALARSVHFPIADVFVGLCEQVREKGSSIWMDKSLKIYHP